MQRDGQGAIQAAHSAVRRTADTLVLPGAMVTLLSTAIVPGGRGLSQEQNRPTIGRCSKETGRSGQAALAPCKILVVLVRPRA